MKNTIRVVLFIAIMLIYSALAAWNLEAGAAFFGTFLLLVFLEEAQRNP